MITQWLQHPAVGPPDAMVLIVWLLLVGMQAVHCVVFHVPQTMCSYIATSTAWPILLGHRELIMMAADLVLAVARKGDLPSLASSTGNSRFSDSP